MPQPFTAFERLHAEWAWLAHSREASAALARWSADPALTGAGSLDEILARRSVADRGSADRVLRALAARCRRDPLAARTLLQALLPALYRLANKIGHGNQDVAGELVGLFWTRLATVAYNTRPGEVAANVLWDLRKYYVREHRRRDDIDDADLDPANRGERPRGQRPTAPLPDDINDLPLVRQGGVWATVGGDEASPQDAVDDRDELVRLFRGAACRPLTTRILWGRACGADNAALRSQLGLTRAQPWDHWRRGVAALAQCAEAGPDARAA